MEKKLRSFSLTQKDLKVLESQMFMMTGTFHLSMYMMCIAGFSLSNCVLINLLQDFCIGNGSEFCAYIQLT